MPAFPNINILYVVLFIFKVDEPIFKSIILSSIHFFSLCPKGFDRELMFRIHYSIGDLIAISVRMLSTILSVLPRPGLLASTGLFTVSMALLSLEDQPAGIMTRKSFITGLLLTIYI